MDADRIATKLWMGSYPREPHIFDGRFGLIVLAAVEHPELPVYCPKQATIHVPLFDDGEGLMQDELDCALDAARTVNRARERGLRVLVTCHQGINRSGLVVALALVLEGLSPDAAIARVRKHRRERKGFKPLCNEAFVKAIRNVGRHERVA